MNKFSYSAKNSLYFNGETFYWKYKDAEFLKDVKNVQNILSKHGELEELINDLKPGESFQVEGMFLKPGSPLIITKSARVDEQDVDVDAFTPRRLSGLAAAYVYDNVTKFPDIYARDAEDLSISWSTRDRTKQRLYLSAVSGAEYFVTHFDCFPLLVGLKKYKLKLINEEMLIDIWKVRDVVGERISKSLLTKISYDPTLRNLEGTFDVIAAIKTLPQEIKSRLDIILK